MGTESARMAYGLDYILSGAERGGLLKEKLPEDGDGGGSFNHGFLLQMNGYISGSARGREMLLEGLELQRKGGHCTRGEQIETNSGSHGQLNQAAAGVSLYHAVKVKDGRVIKALRDWWWTEILLREEMRIPGRESRPFDNKKGGRQADTFGPGWRAMQKGALVGTNACTDLCWRLVMGHPVPRRGHQIWQQQYYLGAIALRMLPEAELKALRPAPGFQPPLPYPLVIHRAEDRFFAQWEAPLEGDLAPAAVHDPTGTSIHDLPFSEELYPKGFHRYPGLRG